MTPDKTISTSTLMITQERVIAIICRYIDTKGLAYAQGRFDEMNADFSAERGWAETAEKIYELFANKRKEEIQRIREEKLEELRTAAPNIHLQNNATSTSDAKNIGKVEVEQMDVDVKSPGNNIARIINIGDSKDNE